MCRSLDGGQFAPLFQGVEDIVSMRRIVSAAT
jgi:hypothetical protein